MMKKQPVKSQKEEEKQVETTNKEIKRLKKNLTDAVMIEALIRANGIHTYAAKSVGLSRSRFSEKVNKSKKLKKAEVEARYKILDIAENKLFEKIEEGNLGAIIFILKCLGKERGYGEKTNIFIDGQLVHKGEITKPDIKVMMQNIILKDDEAKEAIRIISRKLIDAQRVKITKE